MEKTALINLYCQLVRSCFLFVLCWSFLYVTCRCFIGLWNIRWCFCFLTAVRWPEKNVIFLINVMLVWRVVALIDFFCIDSDSADQDFAVKFKGEIISFIELLKSLRLLNASVPKNENVLLSAVFQLNGSSAHSCKGRCFLEERSATKWCYCDKACQAWGDCCLDFHLR